MTRHSGVELVLFSLGLLIDTVHQVIRIPVDKVNRAIKLINWILDKRSNKITLRNLQELCGYLNFLCKAILPGRAFTRRIYAHGAHLTKPNHHLYVTKEIKADLKAWLAFLQTPDIYNRPFFDYDDQVKSEYLMFATDASANPLLGAGGVCNESWFILQWEEIFMINHTPSINFLELYAVTIGVYLWIHPFQEIGG